MPEMNCQTVVDLASRFQPILRYHDKERLFPVLAEAWLAHCSGEPWVGAGAKLRGTAIMHASSGSPGVPPDTSFAGEEFVYSGCENTSLLVSPVLNERGGSREQIGNPTYAQPPDGEDVFLNFGGWDDPVSFSRPSSSYLAEVFSELANALNSSIPPTPLNKLTSTPYPANFQVAQPRKPTAYAEVEWAGIYPRIDRDRPGAQKDFAHEPAGPYTGLDQYLCVTYYFLYPGVEPPPAGDEGVRNLEGQWEAVSVFLKGDPGAMRGRRPRSFENAQPLFLAYSQGFERTDGPNPPVECRPWSDPSLIVEKDGEHPVVYVTAGTHRNMFLLRAGLPPGTGDGSTHVVAVNVGTPGYNDDWGSAGAGLFALGVVAIAAGLLPLGVALMILGIIAAIVGLFVGDDSDPVPEDTPREDPVPPGQENMQTSEKGPAAVPQGGAPGGTPPKASAAVEWELRVIDRFHEDLVGGYPPPGSQCEQPPWWDFGGRWGVKLVEPVAPKVDSGSRRRDRYERSRGYWNARALVQFSQSNPNHPL